MPALSNNQIPCVVQRNSQTGCIPTAIEWMLRYKGVQGINFSNFQERFDLESQRIEGNGFHSVSSAVSRSYPDLIFQSQSFSSGKEKLAFVQNLIAQDRPCLLSITGKPEGGWHIVPVIEIDDAIVKVLWLDNADIEKQIYLLQRSNLEFIHDNWHGGKDILYLDE